jgi:hypothetical protein
MSDSGNAAGLILKLYELRTEPKLRAARRWFGFEFHPQSAKDMLTTWLGPGHESAPYRMVTTYWDMAASLVVQGAIPVELFNAANTEHFAFYAKIRPYLAEVRATTQNLDYLTNLEQVATAGENPDGRLAMYDRYNTRQRGLAAEGKQRSHLGS